MFMTREKRRIPRTFLMVVVLVLAAIAGVGAFRAGAAPEIKITPGFPAIGRRTPVKIEIVEPQAGSESRKGGFRPERPGREPG